MSFLQKKNMCAGLSSTDHCDHIGKQAKLSRKVTEYQIIG